MDGGGPCLYRELGTGIFAGGLVALMVGLLILHLPTEVAKSSCRYFLNKSTPFEVENLMSAPREDVTALPPQASDESSWKPLVTRVVGMA